jgi:hypothetical protein
MPVLAKAAVLACLTAITLCSDTLPSGARNDAWRVLGPGGGGAQYRPTISPHDPNRVLVSCDMTGIYLTRDGGASWRMFNLLSSASFLLFDPVDASVIYVKTIALWRSTDGGDTWNLVHPDPDLVQGAVSVGDHGEVSLVPGGATAESVVALAVDPADSRTLYAAMTAGGRTTLRVSADWGKSWAFAGELPYGASQIYIDPRSPREDRTVYIVGARAVSVRDASAWRHLPPAPAGGDFTDVSGGFPDGEGQLMLYAIAPDGLLTSLDGGETWRKSNPAPQLRAVAASLTQPRVAYLSYRALDGRYFGVARTSDGGQSWDYPWKESSSGKAPNVDDGWISERFGPDWGENPLALGVSPTDPEICYGSDMGRTLRSLDGGRTWTAAYTRKVDGGYTTTGLDVTTNYGLHFDPFDPRHVLISYTDIGLFASENGGASWSSATTRGVPRAWVNTTYWVEFDPDVKGRLWAAMSGTHDLPRPKMWRRTAPATFQGGVCRSDDGGKNWTQLRGGMPQTAATHILLDRRSPPEARVLYVAGFGKGVFKSRDGGETWEQKNNGLPAGEPFAWRLTQDRNGTLYLVIARRSEDASFGTPNDGALYRSWDGAENWEQLPLPDNVNGPNGLAVDPDDPRRLYLAAWSRPVRGQAVGGGIFLSEDGGASWRQVLSRDQHVYDVTIDPRDPSRLYACGFESSAWRSADRGETWERIRGYNFKWGHRVIPDPLNPDMIYVTTFGGSVWYGPAAGDPTAREDIATPQLAY